MREEKTKERETIAERIQPKPQPPAETETTEETEPYKIYNNTIYAIVEQLIDSEYTGKTIEELKQDKSFFPYLVNYVYNNYLGDFFKNKIDYKLQGIKPRYDDIKSIDNIFNIYVGLVYKYKFNNRPSITEFSLFTGISRDTIYEWLKGNVDGYILNNTNEDRRRYITSEYADTVKKWQMASEQSLVDGSGVMEIFLLKSVHGFKDTAPVEINVNHKAIIDADVLPDLIGINGKN